MLIIREEALTDSALLPVAVDGVMDSDYNIGGQGLGRRIILEGDVLN